MRERQFKHILTAWFPTSWSFCDVKHDGDISLSHMYTHRLKLLIIFVHNPNDLRYVVHSYHVLVTSVSLCLLVCLFTFLSITFILINI
jgi:hypothetical protein